MEDPGIVPSTVIAQLTDLHLGPPGSSPYGVDTADHVRRVAEFIGASELDPAAILLTGDLSDEGDAASYEVLRELVDTELASIGAPVLTVVGNHDHRGTFRRVFLGEVDRDVDEADAEPYHHVFDTAEVRIVMCDSYAPGQVTGRLGPEQLRWLDEQLAGADGRTTIVALHHPSVPRGVPRARDYLLEDRDAFAEVLGGHEVGAVLCGHSHVATSAVFGGSLHVAAPATAYLLDPTRRSANRSYVGAGFAVCTVRDAMAVVNPVLLEAW